MLVCFSLWRIRGKYISVLHIESGSRRGCFCCQFRTRFPGGAERICRSGVQDMAKDLSTQTPLIPSKPYGLASAILSIVFCVSGGDLEAVCALSR